MVLYPKLRHMQSIPSTLQVIKDEKEARLASLADDLVCEIQARRLEADSPQDPGRGLFDSAEKLALKNELALLVFLCLLVRFVVLPADHCITLAALDVANDVTAGRHITLVRLQLDDVDDGIE